MSPKDIFPGLFDEVQRFAFPDIDIEWKLLNTLYPQTQPKHSSEDHDMRQKMYEVREKANGFLVEIDRRPPSAWQAAGKFAAENQYLFNTLDDAWKFIGDCMEEDFAEKSEQECHCE